MKKFRKAQLAAAVGLIGTLGLAGQVSADIYAGSQLFVRNLDIQSTNTGDPPGSDITSFEFKITNTAVLNGNPDTSTDITATCGGTFSSNTCGDDPALEADAANAPGGTITRADSNYALFGRTGETYSNSNSLIDTAQLTGDASTSTQQVAESLLQSAGTAGASAEVGSSTGLIFEFDIGVDDTDLTISFEADPSMAVAISQFNFDNGNARAGMTFDVTLSRDSDGEAVTWSPEGTTANDCNVDGGLAGVTCSEAADGEDLNRTISLSSQPNETKYSDGAAWSDYEITIAGLGAGSWTLALTAFTNTSLRMETVPLPGTLLLFGAGLLAVGARRKRLKT